MRKQLFYFILLLLLCSCKNDIKTFLTNGEKRSWYYSNNNNNLPVYFTFYKNGQLQISKQDIDGYLHDYSIARDVRWEKKWKIKGDTLLYIGLYDMFFRVTKQNESTLILENQDRKIVLQAVTNLESFAQKKHHQRKEVVDSLYKIHYKIKVDTLLYIGNYVYLFEGTAFSKKYVRLTKQEKEILNPQKGEFLIKKQNTILLNKVATDTIYLYVYNINMNNLNNYPNLILANESRELRWDKLKNEIIFE